MDCSHRLYNTCLSSQNCDKLEIGLRVNNPLRNVETNVRIHRLFFNHHTLCCATLSQTGSSTSLGISLFAALMQLSFTVYVARKHTVVIDPRR